MTVCYEEIDLKFKKIYIYKLKSVGDNLKISHSFIRGLFKRCVQIAVQQDLGRGLMLRQEVNEVINTSCTVSRI